MLLLGMDTATAATSVAAYDGALALAECTTVDPRRHAEVLANAIADVLRRAGATARDLTAVGVGVGPGPYTGLRVGVATATALADALGVPVHGACTLDVLAQQAGPPCTVVTDAKRGEVFWASYDENGNRVAGPFVTRPADVTATGRVVGPDATVSAAALCELVAARLRDGGELPAARPIYLRRPDTAAPGPPKQLLAT